MGAHGGKLTFADTLHEVIRAARPTPRPLALGECATAQNRPCPLCYARELDYPTEVALRQAALERWWPGACPLEPLVPSPRGRDYRTVTKRRMLGGQLGLIGDRLKPLPVVRCRLEPPAHQQLYERLQASRHYRGLRGALNFAIVKGNYDQHWLLLNVSSLSSGVVSAARKLSAELGEAIAGLLLLEGRPDDDYYLRASRTLKIYGQDRIYARLGGRGFQYPATVFSQVNQSILDALIESVTGMLTGKPLVDLYCGYGLFALTLPSPRVLGLEVSFPAVQAAQANARRFQREARFRALDLEPERLLRELPGGTFEAVVDPPRGGPASGVLRSLASRRPARVVHLFCDVERIQLDLADWRAAGYRPVRAVPFDMFPGTVELEVAVLLEPLERGGATHRRTSRSQPSPKGGPQ